ncbi:hypothetical protein AAFP30_05810 [Gordonia sp. CPCC 205515]|uniref:hypothetical protein n=1 Tax=Gordonia sp. CPCC 205515 TaxID=3140791 RepID=UPI003AF39B45
MLDEYDLDNEPTKIEALTHACRVSGTVAELDKATASEPLTMQSSAGQVGSHPLKSEIGFQRGILAQLLARLSFASIEEN